MYRCAKCGAASEGVTPSFDPRYGSGKCRECGKDRSFVRDDISEGRRLKEEGQEIASGHVMSWSEAAQDWIRRRTKGSMYTSEDVTADLGQPPSSGAVGAVMTAMAKMGYHQKHQIVKARRPNQHAAEIWVWVRL